MRNVFWCMRRKTPEGADAALFSAPIPVSAGLLWKQIFSNVMERKHHV